MIWPDELLGREDRGADVGLADLGDPGGVGHVVRAVDRHDGAVGQRHLVLDARHRRQQLEVVLALEALAHDVHVQQPEEAAAEAEARARREVSGSQLSAASLSDSFSSASRRSG